MRRPFRLPLRALLGTASVLALVAASSGPGAADTLREALIEAYETNPQLEAERAQLRATDELVAQALAGYRPSLFVNGGLEAARGQVGRTRSNAVPSDDGSQTTRRTTSQIGLSIRQNLYAGGGTAASVRRAENQVSAERADLVAAEQDVLLNAVDVYATTWQDRAVLDLALNNEQRLGRQLEATRDRFNVGELARTDVAQAEARLSRASADIETAKADLAASAAAYRRVIGSEPGVLEDPQPLENLPGSLEEALAIASTNPNILAATYALAASRDSIRVALADLLPSLDLTSDFNYANQPTSQSPWQEEAAIGVQVTVPLYQGGAEYSRVRQARQEARQSRHNLEFTQRTIRESVASAWDRLFAARAAIRSFRDEVRANQIALEGVQQEALVGARTVLDVLDAEQELFTSQVNLVRARRVLVVASYQLKAAVGELTAADLALAVDSYDPIAHYERNRTRLFGLDGDR